MAERAPQAAHLIFQGRPRGAILFSTPSRVEGNSWKMHAINADGTGLRQLPEEASDWVWSPNGKLIARWGGAPPWLVVSKSDGTQQRIVARRRLRSMAARPLPVSWSPDSRSIAFADGFDPQDGHIYTVDVRTRRARTLSTGNYPAWSPSGTTIAYIDGPLFQEALYAIGPDGSGRRRLWPPVGASDLSLEDIQWQPRWSPDGQWIAFVTKEAPENVSSLAIIRPDGSDYRRLTPQTREFAVYGSYEIDWAPKGHSLSFTTLNLEAFVVNLDAGTTTRIATGLPNHSDHSSAPRWSPDGSTLVLSRGQPVDIYLVDPSGARLRRLTTARVPKRPRVDPRWHPTGARATRLPRTR